eukprot:TRINITY_DN11829_c0_g1_i1.p1 TRINITY_DN11829_c0_g1~~TRINITY_DN11829_c0_g1_i1.p1  ORF type:complete len:264 (-),score=43.25 TRINITY_DN11829_c0_g1_i1:83-874(-)
MLRLVQHARLFPSSFVSNAGRPHILKCQRTSFRSLSTNQNTNNQQNNQDTKNTNNTNTNNQKSNKENGQENKRERVSSTVKIGLAIAIIFGGLSYAAAPIYRVFCAKTGYGGTVAQKRVEDLVNSPVRTDLPSITVAFNSDVNSSLNWTFKPLQHSVRVFAGEPALAFFNATNNSNEAVTGISSYNVVPFRAGIYFNKVQCFCFEEQQLQPGESVDMPVFFYIDSEFFDDKNMKGITDITLSYTFFRAKNQPDEEKVENTQKL